MEGDMDSEYIKTTIDYHGLSTSMDYRLAWTIVRFCASKPKQIDRSETQHVAKCYTIKLKHFNRLIAVTTPIPPPRRPARCCARRPTLCPASRVCTHSLKSCSRCGAPGTQLTRGWGSVSGLTGTWTPRSHSCFHVSAISRYSSGDRYSESGSFIALIRSVRISWRRGGRDGQSPAASSR